MQHMVNPRQKVLFDPFEHMLAPAVLDRLRQGWQGVMRHVILELLPVGVLAAQRHETLGCPTKELYSVAGLLFVMEFSNWTREQAVEAHALNLGVQYALNLAPGGGGMSVRTLARYRSIFLEDNQGAEIFERVTQALVQTLQLNMGEQRLDSTHVFSDMALFGRTQLMGVAVKRFLTQLLRHDQEAHNALPEELRARYAPSANHLFADTARDRESRRRLRQQVAEDMHALVQRFEGDGAHNGRTSYQHLRRVFLEQCEVREERVVIREKTGGRVMQNPSDPDATFDGKKGSGYQVQVAETCAQDNEVQLVTAALPQTAADPDAEALVPVLENLAASARVPGSMLADAAYGSDGNVEKAKTMGVELVSPVNTSRRDPDTLHAGDFAIEPGTERVQACPAGHAPLDSAHNAQTGVTTTHMDPRDCGGCPHRDRCCVTGKNTRTFTHTPGERRRAERHCAEQDPQWRKRYAKRSGIEGLMSRLKRCAGLGRLRVRGRPAVFNAICLKLAGWNIRQAAKAQAMRELVEKRAKEACCMVGAACRNLKNALCVLLRAQGMIAERRHGT